MRHPMNNLLDNYDKMTADQVRKHPWTDEELDHLVAVKVMGWERKRIRYTGEVAVFIFFCDGKEQCWQDNWHPSTDMNDAMTVAGEFEVFELEMQCNKKFVASLLPIKSIEDSLLLSYLDKSPSRAICIAALLAKK